MQLLTILLQAAGEQIGLQRLIDAGLSLGILAIITSVLWRKLKNMEDRMNKYLDEDRKEMIEVIENNTRAFDKLSNHLDKIH